MKSLSTQFTQFLIEEGFSKRQWIAVLTEYGVNEVAKDVDRFYQSWNFGDEDRLENTIKFFKLIHNKQSDELAISIMKRAYQLLNGATDEQLEKYPALEVLEKAESDPNTLDNLILNLRSEQFLEIENIPGQFYPELVEDINRCFQIGVYDAAFILTRKLLENLLIDIFRQKYGTDRIELYYDPEHNYHRNFNDLIANFEDNLDDFDSWSTLGDGFIEQLDAFRKTANANAHSIETNLSQEEFTNRREEANHSVRVLFRIRSTI